MPATDPGHSAHVPGASIRYLISSIGPMPVVQSLVSVGPNAKRSRATTLAVSAADRALGDPRPYAASARPAG